GPFGNVARALRRDPTFATGVRDLVVMGGAARPPGNALPFGEFNVAWDPTAAREMFLAPWPRPPLMVGLDVTHRATLTEPELAVLDAGRTPAARFMAAPMAFYRPIAAVQTEDGNCPSHDTLATMCVAHPELVTTEELPVDVDNGGGA